MPLVFDLKMPKNLFKNPGQWGSDVKDLVNILNKYDIPLKAKEEIQDEINNIAEMQVGLTESALGRDA